MQAHYASSAYVLHIVRRLFSCSSSWALLLSVSRSKLPSTWDNNPKEVATEPDEQATQTRALDITHLSVGLAGSNPSSPRSSNVDRRTSGKPIDSKPKKQEHAPNTIRLHGGFFFSVRNVRLDSTGIPPSNEGKTWTYRIYVAPRQLQTGYLGHMSQLTGDVSRSRKPYPSPRYTNTAPG